MSEGTLKLAQLRKMPHTLIILITGCSTGGIGFELSKEFARQNCKVYATSRSQSTMQGFESPLIKTLALDVTSDDEVHQVVQHVLATEGKIDILVNNAGILGISPLIDLSLETVKTTFDVNTFSALRVAKAIIPAMAARKSGLIINIGSVVGDVPTPWNGLYSSSKAALHILTEVLAMECRPLNIKVSLVTPGAVKSNISKNHAATFQLPPDSLYKPFLNNIIARMYTSQGSAAVSTDIFAKDIVTKALRKNPPSYILSGGSAWVFKVMKWLPRVWVMLFMWRLHSSAH